LIAAPALPLAAAGETGRPLRQRMAVFATGQSRGSIPCAQFVGQRMTDFRFGIRKESDPNVIRVGAERDEIPDAVGLGDSGPPSSLAGGMSPRRSSDGRWVRGPGSGTAMTIGSDGTAWLLGTDRIDGGHSVHRWTGSEWQRVPGGAVALSAGQAPWLVNAAGNVFRWDAPR
jgi:hypothetical protein